MVRMMLNGSSVCCIIVLLQHFRIITTPSTSMQVLPALFDASLGLIQWNQTTMEQTIMELLSHVPPIRCDL
jgi:hypothetical protein